MKPRCPRIDCSKCGETHPVRKKCKIPPERICRTCGEFHSSLWEKKREIATIEYPVQPYGDKIMSWPGDPLPKTVYSDQYEPFDIEFDGIRYQCCVFSSETEVDPESGLIVIDEEISFERKTDAGTTKLDPT